MKRDGWIFQCYAYVGFFAVLFFAVDTFHEAIPNEIYVEMGEEVNYDFGVPITVELSEETKEAFSLGYEPIVNHSYKVVCKLFGIFPVKEIEVFHAEGEIVYAGGTVVGIYAKTTGVLVIGNGSIESENGEEICPSENLIKIGDYIVSVNGEPVDKKEELANCINAYGAEKEILGLIRNEEYIEVAVEPVEAKSGDYMLGLWVRDDLAGIGTLTYYDSNGAYGALGHPISDGDTGTEIRLESGDLYEANIVGITKGESGTPGEISGVINYQKRKCFGSISENCGCGIYGTLDGNLDDFTRGEAYPIAYKQDIRIGEAYILSDISGEIERYNVEIVSLDYSGTYENKGILLRVTDEALIELTGGIVQGMSGSPIIQNGKLVGAVTHVLVNDPTRGYGVFIENMLEH